MDRHRRPMTPVQVKLPRYFQPGVQYVTLTDGSIRRADRRPLEAALTDQRPRLSLANVWRYVSAELSRIIEGPVSDAVYEARIGPSGCGGCQHRIETTLDAVGFCGACGCGQTPRSALTVKGRMPEASCPLPTPRWGKADGAGATLGGVIDGVAGMVRQVRHVLRRPRRTLTRT